MQEGAKKFANAAPESIMILKRNEKNPGEEE
jgi:hypothetical protein